MTATSDDGDVIVIGSGPGGASLAYRSRATRLQVRRILRISRVVADLDRAEAFYRDALCFITVTRGPADLPMQRALGAPDGGAEEVVLRLGAEEIALVRFAAPGQPYPRDSRSNDLWFQHLAIAVTDMEAAYAHLRTCADWQPISAGGPQLLPPANGNVQAFKFRDPDGHPLELICFPPGQGRAVWRSRAASATPFLGIDHSALAVASTRRSLGFYRALGLRVVGRSLNRGPAQAGLDRLPGAQVRVTGLRPAAATGPGLELLAYRPPGRPAETARANDLVTDWVTMAIGPSSGDFPCALRDPDGHRLVLVDQGVDRVGLRSSGVSSSSGVMASWLHRGVIEVGAVPREQRAPRKVPTSTARRLKDTVNDRTWRSAAGDSVLAPVDRRCGR